MLANLPELARTNRVLIIKRMNFKNPSCDVIFEFGDHAFFQTRLDFAVAPSTTEQASHLDYG